MSAEPTLLRFELELEGRDDYLHRILGAIWKEINEIRQEREEPYAVPPWRTLPTSLGLHLGLPIKGRVRFVTEANIADPDLWGKYTRR